MRKILNLKKWLTLSEAAGYLSIAFSEAVTEADILFFGLEKELGLSVQFVNGAMAQRGNLITSTERDLPNIGSKNYIQLSESAGVMLDPEISYLRGIYDLPLWGAESIYVTEKYQKLMNGPIVDLVSTTGTFVKDEDNIYLLQSAYDEDDRRPGSEAWLNKAIRNYRGRPDAELKRALQHYDGDRKSTLTHAIDGYVSAWGMPSDTVLGVRTHVMREFLTAQEPPQEVSSNERNLGARERNTLLSLIAVLCEASGYDIARAAKTAVAITGSAHRAGIEIGESTIEKYLKLIPEAVRRRPPSEPD